MLVRDAGALLALAGLFSAVCAAPRFVHADALAEERGAVQAGEGGDSGGESGGKVTDPGMVLLYAGISLALTLFAGLM
jgi:hypothetical protein